MPTLFVYADESGQDPTSPFFGVGVAIVTGIERDESIPQLLQIEQETKKRNRKWNGSNPRYRQPYIEQITKLKDLKKKIFFKKFPKEKHYLEFTVDAIASALQKVKPDRAVIYMDGLPKGSIPDFKRLLKPSVKAPTKVQGVRKEENNPLIRLADAICGVVRDAAENDKWAKKMVKLLEERGILTEL